MADLHKLTVQEAMNASGPGGVWTVNGVSTTGSNADVANTVHVDVSGAGQLGLYSSLMLLKQMTSNFQLLR